VETNDLILTLSRGVTPVRRLPHPMTRAALWLALSLPYIAAIVVVYEWAGFHSGLAFDTRLVIEELAMLATAVTAAIAAFCCIVPGRDRRIALLPLLPLSVWLASMGETCLDQWDRYGPAGMSLRTGWECLPPSILIGILPAAAMVVMLRRGAPLFPRSAVLLGALAVAALGNLGMRIFHVGDVTIMMLVWHLGAVALLFAAAGYFAPRLLGWRYLTPTAQAPGGSGHR
jgi:hypothetical protein